AIMNQSRTIRLPAHVVKELNIVLRALRHLETHGMLGADREPTLDVVAHLLGKPVEQVRKVLGYKEHVTSLDAPIDAEHGLSVGDQLADDDALSPELVLHNSEIEGWIRLWLNELSDRQRRVIERRYGLNGTDVATLEQLAGELGVTRERVRQIQAEALDKLRARLRVRGLPRDALLQQRAPLRPARRRAPRVGERPFVAPARQAGAREAAAESRPQCHRRITLRVTRPCQAEDHQAPDEYDRCDERDDMPGSRAIDAE